MIHLAVAAILKALPNESKELLLCAGVLILTGLDLQTSWTRWKQGSKDLNPLVEYFRQIGPWEGAAALLWLNLTVLTGLLLLGWFGILEMLLGAKLALAAIQIRSKIEYGKYARKS